VRLLLWFWFVLLRVEVFCGIEELVAFVKGGSSGPRVWLLAFAGTTTDELAVSDSFEERLADELVFV